MSGSIDYQGVSIQYDYMAAQQETPPSYASGGEPSYPATLEITSADLECWRSWAIETRNGPMPDDFLEWAQNNDMVMDMCWDDADKGDF